VRLEFSELGADRCAIGHLGSWTVAVPDGVPGDLADVEVRGRHDGAYRGHLLTLVRPSPLRVRPQCPVFDRCGGCQWQRVDTTAQAEYKGALVRRALETNGKGQIPVRTIPATIPWGYRTAGTYVPVAGGQAPALGLHAAAGPSPVSIDRCLIQSPALQRAFEETQQAWRALALLLREDERGVTLCRQVRIRVGEASQEVAIGLILQTRPTLQQRDAIVGEICAHVSRVVEIAAIVAPRAAPSIVPIDELHWGRHGVVEAMLEYWYQAPVFAPFPVSGRVASEAITSAIEALGLDETTTLLETEAGIGAYTLPGAAPARRVIARTASEHVDIARRNAEWNNVANVVFVDRSAHTLAAALRSEGPVHRALVQLTHTAVPFDKLYDTGVQRVVLLTHSPARLAEGLATAHVAGFEAQSVTVIDTHPQTSRAEIHATLDARRKPRSIAHLRVIDGRVARLRKPLRRPGPPGPS
jgi:tRNA/tmRNA/rRNA uracil-C5-methylase (TrmA/RlmC/RlmD family)